MELIIKHKEIDVKLGRLFQMRRSVKQVFLQRSASLPSRLIYHNSLDFSGWKNICRERINP